jgi:hypothetical protein
MSYSNILVVLVLVLDVIIFVSRMVDELTIMQRASREDSIDSPRLVICEGVSRLQCAR